MNWANQEIWVDLIPWHSAQERNSHTDWIAIIACLNTLEEAFWLHCETKFIVYVVSSFICLTLVGQSQWPCGLSSRSHFRFSKGRQLPGRATTQFESSIISPVVTGRSNDRERGDQAVMHADWSVLYRYSIIALSLLYRRRKRRSSRMH